MVMVNVASLANEVYQDKHRLTAIVATIGMGCTLGNLLAALINVFISNWRVFLALLNLWAILCLFLLYNIRESILFLLDNKSYQQAFHNINLALK
jgi:predicted MFS family arabinose efflux permease